MSTTSRGWSTTATIAENGYNIAVSSYVEAEDTREAVDITALNAEIARIVARQAELRTQIDAIVADLEGGRREPDRRPHRRALPDGVASSRSGRSASSSRQRPAEVGPDDEGYPRSTTARSTRHYGTWTTDDEVIRRAGMFAASCGRPTPATLSSRRRVRTTRPSARPRLARRRTGGGERRRLHLQPHARPEVRRLLLPDRAVPGPEAAIHDRHEAQATSQARTWP